MLRDVTAAKRAETERLRLTKKLEEQNAQLEQRIRELAALNQLFQEHLKERFEVAQAYQNLLDELERDPQDLKDIIQRARSQSLPDLRDLTDLGL